MAIVQAYTKTGVDAKFNSRSNMSLVHNGGGNPDISAYPDSKTGDIIERASDGARWTVVASTINPIAGRVTSVAGKTGAVTLTPANVGAAPASHTHTKAHITDLNASTSATANSMAQRDSSGRLVVATPTTTTHATTKAYVDSQITGGITWSNLSGKPSTFPPSSHTHTKAQITDLNTSMAATENSIAQRTTGGTLFVGTPTATTHATTKSYVDGEITASKAWANLTGKPSTFTPSTHSHTQAQVTGLPAKLTTYDAAVSRVDNRITSVSGSSTDSGKLLSLTSTGRLTAVNPTATTDVANKQYVDSEISAKTTWANTSGKPSTFPPSSHNHTISQITDLTLSQTATANTVVQRDSSGKATVATPTATGHATTKAYVDNAVTAAKAWTAITGKPSTFTPSSHTHTVSQISDLPVIASHWTPNAIVMRGSDGQVSLPTTPVNNRDATSKSYVDSKFKSTALTTQDLNGILTPGYYNQDGTIANPTVDRNYPTTRRGYLQVIDGGDYIRQEYVAHQSNSVYIRTHWDGYWTDWYSYSGTKVG